MHQNLASVWKTGLRLVPGNGCERFSLGKIAGKRGEKKLEESLWWLSKSPASWAVWQPTSAAAECIQVWNSHAGLLSNWGLLPSSNNAQPSDACGVVGLAFSGPQIQSATVLLDQDVADERTAEAAMQRLKAANIPECNTIGFMFACVGRGYRHYKTKRNMEADAFRKFFPSVPLFGFFGHGEIGCDRIVTGNFVLRECNDVKDDLLHGYTTVMTLIHLGSTKANQAWVCLQCISELLRPEERTSCSQSTSQSISTIFVTLSNPVVGTVECNSCEEALPFV